MKVSDVMSRQVDFVTTATSIKEVCRLIFGRGINGLPVCREKKVVGFITERDILGKFYPSVEEYIEDPVHESDFEAMEKKVSEIFSLKAETIMSRNPTTVEADTPLLRAQSLMTLHKVGRLPVIDEAGDLIGIISRGDIFRSLVGDKLPFAADEEYHDWLAKHYDLIVQWGERLGNEVPDLTTLFRREGIKEVLDIGCGTGEHDIALAKEGFRVLGVESSLLMYQAAVRKLSELSAKVRENIAFAHGNYVQIAKEQTRMFGAAIFMGNAFSHLAEDYKEILAAVVKSLSIKNSLLVFQIINYEKVFKVRHRFLDVNFAESKFGIPHEHAFIEFYDPPMKQENFLRLNMAIFDFDGKRWKHRSMNSTPIVPLDRESMTTLLRKHGLKTISFYGSMFLGPLFKDPFKPLESDWLNVVAKR